MTPITHAGEDWKWAKPPVHFYVDHLVPWSADGLPPAVQPSPSLMVACHLSTNGSVADLDAFMKQVCSKAGVSPSQAVPDWRDNHPDLPHYDLSPTLRGIALELGATPTETKTMVAIWADAHPKKSTTAPPSQPKVPAMSAPQTKPFLVAYDGGDDYQVVWSPKPDTSQVIGVLAQVHLDGTLVWQLMWGETAGPLGPPGPTSRAWKAAAIFVTQAEAVSWIEKHCVQVAADAPLTGNPSVVPHEQSVIYYAYTKILLAPLPLGLPPKEGGPITKAEIASKAGSALANVVAAKVATPQPGDVVTIGGSGVLTGMVGFYVGPGTAGLVKVLIAGVVCTVTTSVLIPQPQDVQEKVKGLLDTPPAEPKLTLHPVAPGDAPPTYVASADDLTKKLITKLAVQRKTLLALGTKWAYRWLKARLEAGGGSTESAKAHAAKALAHEARLLETLATFQGLALTDDLQKVATLQQWSAGSGPITPEQTKKALGDDGDDEEEDEDE